MSDNAGLLMFTVMFIGLSILCLTFYLLIRKYIKLRE